MNSFREIFDAQKAYFATNATKSYDWRIEQLDRMGRMLKENDARLQQAISRDFKTAWQEKVFEVLAPLATIDFIKVELKGWMEPVKEPVPRFLTSAGYEGIVHREPYGVALIMGPFNGPLTLLLHPALAALSAGNTCILKLHEALVATSALLTELVPRYFDPRAVATVSGRREEVTELLTLPFDFIFFTGSTKVGKIVMEAAAKNLTPVLLELGGQNPASRRRDRQPTRRGQEDCLGRDRVGRTVVHLSGLRLRPGVRRRRLRRRMQEGRRRTLWGGAEDERGLFPHHQLARGCTSRLTDRCRQGGRRGRLGPSCPLH